MTCIYGSQLLFQLNARLCSINWCFKVKTSRTKDSTSNDIDVAPKFIQSTEFIYNDYTSRLPKKISLQSVWFIFTMIKWSKCSKNNLLSLFNISKSQLNNFGSKSYFTFPALFPYGYHNYICRNTKYNDKLICTSQSGYGDKSITRLLFFNL